MHASVLVFQQKGLATIDFFSGFSSDTSISDDKRKAHGIIMSFAWGILAIAGAFVARSLFSPV